MFLLKLANHPFPECKWLRMGIVHPEDMDPLVNPEFNNALEFLPRDFATARISKSKG